MSHINDDALAELELGRVEEITYAGAAGDQAHMLLLYPPGFEAAGGVGRRWPLLHVIHGGPYGVSGDQWHWRWNAQVMAAPGYVTAMVNFHGSSSFGEAYARSILGDWGGKCATDILLATDLLVGRGFVDEQRIAIAGGSYGGYMTCWLASQTDRFACAIAHAAVYDLGSTWACDATQGLDQELGGAPWGGPEARAAIERWNPAAFAAGYKTPMLVVHGEKDYRVPVTQALELYGILKAKGVEARLVYYPDENHWILKPRSSLHWYGEFLAWLRRWIGEPAAPQAAQHPASEV
jgi:dipeptidyl aminopeptidase/acylaminoacyl peptidase